MKRRRSYVLEALQMNCRMSKVLRSDLRIATRLGDRFRTSEIYRGFMKVLSDTMELLNYSENPPEPLIEYEKLKKVFRVHQEAVGALLSDQPDFTPAQYSNMISRAEELTKELRKGAKDFLNYMERYFPDLMTSDRRTSLRKMAGIKSK